MVNLQRRHHSLPALRGLSTIRIFNSPPSTPLNMKFASAAVLLALVVVSSAQFSSTFGGPTGRVAQTLQRDETRSDNGEYTLTYVTENGITVNEVGRLVPNDEGTGFVLIKQGSSSYTSPEGRVISTAFEADRHGYRASGDHLPVAPVA